MNELGFIKLSRKLLKWQWFGDPNMVSLWVYLIIKANYKETKWNGKIINRGELVTGLHRLSEDTGISIQTLRTCLKKLKSTNEITIKSTNKYSIITICNYNVYQLKEDSTNKQGNKPTNNPLTNDQQTTNNIQEYLKNKKNLFEDIFSRKEKFRNEVFKFDEYDEEHLEQFFNYWSEETHDKQLMRFETEEYWNTNTRLSRFKPIEYLN